MQSDRKMVRDMRNGLYHLSGISILLSTHSTIFMAGKAMNISITIEKTRVRTISIMIIVRKTDVQSLILFCSEKEVLPAVNHCYLR